MGNETLKLIADSIVEYNKSIGDLEGYGLGSVETILNALEKAGMLPPERKLGLRETEALRQWNVSDQINAYFNWDKE